jgi:uncharacterized protein (UPF0332 family)
MTPDQEELLTKAQQSLEAAKLLLDGGFPGFAASRAYYAMFYVAQAFLEGEGLSYSKHSAVIAAFGQHFAREGRIPVEFHRYLIDAMAARQDADYAQFSEIDRVSAQKHIDHAAQFIAEAARLINTVSKQPNNKN